MTTILRSCAGSATVRLALAVVICAGLGALSIADCGSADCGSSADRDPKWTNSVAVSAPDSCDDDDAGDDGDDELSGGSAPAIPGTGRSATDFAQSVYLTGMPAGRRASRTPDAHSLRGPPPVGKNPSEAEDDLDASPGVFRSATAAAVNSPEPPFVSSSDQFRIIAARSGYALRAPP
ncbi:MAG TPA: hypothetical protein VKD69_04260 [Vicinamibacterales bacterium]|nr:hypothetical protein [Vicinamibacterales bacterium]